MLKKTFILVLIIIPSALLGQSDSTSIFDLSVEFQPRFEYRNGYRELATDTSSPAMFVSQRSRLILTYKRKKFKFHTSIQDIRVWGQYGSKSNNGGLGIFEAYAESKFNDHWSIRIGRQGVDLDNGRLFSTAPFSLTAKAHEGLRLMFANAKVQSDLLLFYNQSGEQLFGTSYALTAPNYTTLSVHYFKMRLSKLFSISTTNAMDGYQSLSSSNTMYMRGTSGGRITLNKKGFFATICGYYQYGQLQSGQPISAFYLQPEIAYKLKKMKATAGMEYLSGDDATASSEQSRSFVPLYGVILKFMGNLNYFANFPNDLAGGGLVNPYLLLQWQIHKKFLFHFDTHVFYLQNNVEKNGAVLDPFLGLEHDFRLQYKINDFTTLTSGFAFMLPTESLAEVQNKNTYRTPPVWSFIMLRYNPQLLYIERNIKKKSHSLL